MANTITFKNLVIFTFALYLVLDNIGIDITLGHVRADQRLPFHRIYLFLTAFIFLFNMQQVITAFLNNKLFVTLILYVLVSSAWSSSPINTVKNFTALLAIMTISVTVIMVYFNDRRLLIRRLFQLFFIFIFANIVTTLLFPQVCIDTVNFGYPRWIGITTHPNVLGVTALVLIWLASNLYFSATSFLKRVTTLIALAMGYYVILKADSITSLFSSLAISCYVFYSYKLANLNFLVKMFTIISIILIFITILGFYKSLPDLISSILETGGRNATLTGRTKLWRIAFLSIQDHLFFGYGFDDLRQVTERQYKQRYQMSHLHNGFIEILLKGGIIGIFLLAATIFRTIYYQFKLRKKYRYDCIFLNSGLIMIILHNFAESSILRGTMTIGVFFIFIIVFTNLLYQHSQYENLDLHTRI